MFVFFTLVPKIKISKKSVHEYYIQLRFLGRRFYKSIALFIEGYLLNTVDESSSDDHLLWTDDLTKMDYSEVKDFEGRKEPFFSRILVVEMMTPQ